MNIVKSTIVIFDNNCNFCIASANFLKKRDIHKKLEFIPVQSQEARGILKEKGIIFIDLKTIYLVDKDEILVRSRAVFRILSKLPFPASLLSLPGILPVFITDFFYNLIAKNRHKFKKQEDKF